MKVDLNLEQIICEKVLVNSVVIRIRSEGMCEHSTDTIQAIFGPLTDYLILKEECDLRSFNFFSFGLKPCFLDTTDAPEEPPPDHNKLNIQCNTSVYLFLCKLRAKMKSRGFKLCCYFLCPLKTFH